MEFVLWASKVVHVIAVVVWLGGLIYYNAILVPVLQYEKQTRVSWLRGVETRAQGVIWSVATPMILTGAILLIFQPRLSGVAWDDPWTILIAAKILCAFLMVFFGWQAGVVIRTMRSLPPDDHALFEDWFYTLQKLVRRGIVCGIAAVLAAVSLTFV